MATNRDESTELIIQPCDIQPVDTSLVPAFVQSIDRARLQLAQLRQFVKEIMVPGEDYGVIPGTEKPTLLKPGAEKLNEIYGYAAITEVTQRVEDWTNGFFHYECRTRIVHKGTGCTVAEGVGSCNSKEKRYAARWVFGNDIPVGVDKAALSKREFKKRDGSGTFWKYLVPNEDIFSLVNTILKMASKRSMVDATLRATRSSGLFTQDMEDLTDVDLAAPKPAAAKRQPQEDKPKPPAATVIDHETGEVTENGAPTEEAGRSEKDASDEAEVNEFDALMGQVEEMKEIRDLSKVWDAIRKSGLGAKAKAEVTQAFADKKKGMT